MNCVDLVELSNKLYEQTYTDFNHNNNDRENLEQLENTPLIHEIPHIICGMLGGIDNAYIVIELLTIPIEIGMLTKLYLADRNIDDSFIEQTTIKQSKVSVDYIFNQNNGKKCRYIAANTLLKDSDYITKFVYYNIAYNLMIYFAKRITNELVGFGETIAQRLITDFNLQLEEFDRKGLSVAEYYPKPSLKEEKILSNNEKQFRELMQQLSVEHLSKLVYSSISPELLFTIKQFQAIFLHIITAHQPSLCAYQVNIPYFPNEFVVWERDSNNKIIFNKQKASLLLNTYLATE